MQPHSHFWKAIHRTAGAYGGQGATPQERADNILAALDAMPTELWEQAMKDLDVIGTYLPEIEGMAKGRR
jgi:hypothetical protein